MEEFNKYANFWMKLMNGLIGWSWGKEIKEEIQVG